MLKTYLYIPEPLNNKITSTAKMQNKSKAEVIREALESGINTITQQGIASGQVMLKIADLGKRYNVKGPKDLSTHMDEYLWETYEP